MMLIVGMRVILPWGLVAVALLLHVVGVQCSSGDFSSGASRSSSSDGGSAGGGESSSSSSSSGEWVPIGTPRQRVLRLGTYCGRSSNDNAFFTFNFSETSGSSGSGTVIVVSQVSSDGGTYADNILPSAPPRVIHGVGPLQALSGTERLYRRQLLKNCEMGSSSSGGDSGSESAAHPHTSPGPQTPAPTMVASQYYRTVFTFTMAAQIQSLVQDGGFLGSASFGTLTLSYSQPEAWFHEDDGDLKSPLICEKKIKKKFAALPTQLTSFSLTSNGTSALDVPVIDQESCNLNSSTVGGSQQRNVDQCYGASPWVSSLESRTDVTCPKNGGGATAPPTLPNSNFIETPVFTYCYNYEGEQVAGVPLLISKSTVDFWFGGYNASTNLEKPNLNPDASAGTSTTSSPAAPVYIGKKELAAQHAVRASLKELLLRTAPPSPLPSFDELTPDRCSKWTLAAYNNSLDRDDFAYFEKTHPITGFCKTKHFIFHNRQEKTAFTYQITPLPSPGGNSIGNNILWLIRRNEDDATVRSVFEPSQLILAYRQNADGHPQLLGAKPVVSAFDDQAKFPGTRPLLVDDTGLPVKFRAENVSAKTGKVAEITFPQGAGSVVTFPKCEDQTINSVVCDPFEFGQTVQVTYRHFLGGVSYIQPDLQVSLWQALNEPAKKGWHRFGGPGFPLSDIERGVKTAEKLSQRCPVTKTKELTTCPNPCVPLVGTDTLVNFLPLIAQMSKNADNLNHAIQFLQKFMPPAQAALTAYTLSKKTTQQKLTSEVFERQVLNSTIAHPAMVEYACTVTAWLLMMHHVVAKLGGAQYSMTSSQVRTYLTTTAGLNSSFACDEMVDDLVKFTELPTSAVVLRSGPLQSSAQIQKTLAQLRTNNPDQQYGAVERHVRWYVLGYEKLPDVLNSAVGVLLKYYGMEVRGGSCLPLIVTDMFTLSWGMYAYHSLFLVLLVLSLTGLQELLRGENKSGRYYRYWTDCWAGCLTKPTRPVMAQADQTKTQIRSNIQADIVTRWDVKELLFEDLLDLPSPRDPEKRELELAFTELYLRKLTGGYSYWLMPSEKKAPKKREVETAHVRNELLAAWLAMEIVSQTPQTFTLKKDILPEWEARKKGTRVTSALGAGDEAGGGGDLTRTSFVGADSHTSGSAYHLEMTPQPSNNSLTNMVPDGEEEELPPENRRLLMEHEAGESSAVVPLPTVPTSSPGDAPKQQDDALPPVPLTEGNTRTRAASAGGEGDILKPPRAPRRATTTAVNSQTGGGGSGESLLPRSSIIVGASYTDPGTPNSTRTGTNPRRSSGASTQTSMRTSPSPPADHSSSLAKTQVFDHFVRISEKMRGDHIDRKYRTPMHFFENRLEYALSLPGWLVRVMALYCTILFFVGIHNGHSHQEASPFSHWSRFYLTFFPVINCPFTLVLLMHCLGPLVHDTSNKFGIALQYSLREGRLFFYLMFVPLGLFIPLLFCLIGAFVYYQVALLWLAFGLIAEVGTWKLYSKLELDLLTLPRSGRIWFHSVNPDPARSRSGGATLLIKTIPAIIRVGGRFMAYIFFSRAIADSFNAMALASTSQGGVGFQLDFQYIWDTGHQTYCNLVPFSSEENTTYLMQIFPAAKLTPITSLMAMCILFAVSIVEPIGSMIRYIRKRVR